jgi:hypothetical protein
MVDSDFCNDITRLIVSNQSVADSNGTHAKTPLGASLREGPIFLRHQAVTDIAASSSQQTS